MLENRFALRKGYIDPHSDSVNFTRLHVRHPRQLMTVYIPELNS